jgi:hypothetical protein
MNLIKLKEFTEEYVIYYYHPEERGTLGEIRMDLNSDKAYVLLKASEDDTGYFAHKASKAIERCVKTDKSLPLIFRNMWY